MADKQQNNTADIANINKLDGRVPLLKAIPFGLQHVLAMFVANLAPIILIAGAVKPALDEHQVAGLLQNAIFVSGLATLIQLYPIWRIGARLPIVMGVSFTFVAVLSGIASAHGYSAVIGAVLVGGVIEGLLGLTVKNWHRIVPPIVSAAVVTCIGISLFPVGARSFGGGYSPDFGSFRNLALGFITLLICLLWNEYAKGYFKQLSVLVGMIAGYIIALIGGFANLDDVFKGSLISLPKLLPFIPEFNIADIVSVSIIFLVSAAETLGDTSAMVRGGLDRDITDRELSGSIACDGFTSSLSALFGCPPTTSFSQNVGLINMTKVVNRFTIMTGAACLILAGIFPPIAHMFAAIPPSVLGGCTIAMFGSITASGFTMISECGFSKRNITIISLALSIGIGFTGSGESEIWKEFPEFFRMIFAQNSVATVFIIAAALNLFLPKEKKKMDAEEARNQSAETAEKPTEPEAADS
ncbi:purine permease [bacterium]|nr:purine permease [bacterium]